MPPRTEPTDTSTDAATMADEGAGYAAALLERIAQGTAGPGELASLMQFLHSGDLLHGACVVMNEALRQATQRPGAS